MATEARRTGDAAEAAVARALVKAGWRILARGLRLGRDELDIVAVDPGPPSALVVLEVRARGRRDYGLPEETLDHRKRRALRRACAALRTLDALDDGTSLPRLPMRFDVVAVEPSSDGRAGPRVRHHRGVGL